MARSNRSGAASMRGSAAMRGAASMRGSAAMRRGQTIVAARERVVSDSERFAARKKAKKKKTYAYVVTLVFFVVVSVIIAMNWDGIFNGMVTPATPEVEVFKPSVTIEDESGSGLITQRMADYVGQMEQDFKDKGFKVTRAIIPSGKTREVDIYLEGREEFYKMNLDRGTAVSVEDAERMVRYLTEHDLHPAYVDLRVAGKAFYR